MYEDDDPTIPNGMLPDPVTAEWDGALEELAEDVATRVRPCACGGPASGRCLGCGAGQCPACLGDPCARCGA